MSQLEDRERRERDPNKPNSEQTAMHERSKEPKFGASPAAQKSEKPQRAVDLLPHITTPKGGGAIRGMGEKIVGSNPATGYALELDSSTA